MKMRKIDVWWLTAQTFAIVGSILLAFGIEAWWQHGQERDEEQVLLQELSKEFIYNLDQSEIGMRRFSAKANAARKILELKTQSTPIDERVFDQLLWDLSFWWISKYSSGTVGSVTQGGKLHLISNDELRSELAGWREKLTRVDTLSEQDRQSSKTLYMVYLLEHASMTQLHNIEGASVNSKVGGDPSVTKVPLLESKNHSVMLEDPRFISIMVQTIWDSDDMILSIGGVVEDMTRIRELINSQLD